jgi:hypothetical protein
LFSTPGVHVVTTDEKTTKRRYSSRERKEDQQEIKSEGTFCDARKDEIIRRDAAESNAKQQTR